jgi:hypothetical protein
VRFEIIGSDWRDFIDEENAEAQAWMDARLPERYLVAVQLVDEGRARLLTFGHARPCPDWDWYEWCRCGRCEDAGVITTAAYIETHRLPTPILRRFAESARRAA